MQAPDPAKPTILVASDDCADADLVLKQLLPAFDRVSASTDPCKAAEDFERLMPQVLVLAFRDMARSERYFRELCQVGAWVHKQPYRTVLLCRQEEGEAALRACLDEEFDDCFVFWPVTDDAQRLQLVVHRALRDLAAAGSAHLLSGQLVAQVRRLEAMGGGVEQRMAQLAQRLDALAKNVAQAEAEYGVVFDRFAWKVAQAAPAAAKEGAADWPREIKRIKQDEIRPILRRTAESARSIGAWADEFRKLMAPHLDAVRGLKCATSRIPTTVLVVDDDGVQRELLREMLAPEGYQVIVATDGVDALSILRRMTPDLILMDMVMPGLDGIETTRHLRGIPRLSAVPVIMVTSNSQEIAVLESISAGAADFVVKPFEPEMLFAKMTRALLQ